MSKDNSIKSDVQQKPERPEGSPLFWHPSGRWCKKIRGKQYYFGRGSHDDALVEYKRQKDDLHAGRRSRDDEQQPEGLTVYTLVAKFLDAKRDQRNEGDLSTRSFDDYAALCKRIITVFGKNRLVSDLQPDDFAKLRKDMARTWGPYRMRAEIARARVPFQWAFDSKLIEQPMAFGPGFKPPSKRTIRQHKNAQGPKMFEADELRTMMDKATLPLRAMLLLGANAGFGNSDCGHLPMHALDLDGAFVNFPRQKTAIERRIPLWPETVQALRDWLAVRPAPAKDAHKELVFLTVRGDSWAKETTDNPVSKETAKLMKECGLNGHRNFYCLRHTFQTIGDDTGDFIAVRKIMGHASKDIADVYRERVSDERLRKVTDHVRAWLFDDADGGKGAKPAAKENERPKLRVVG